ncbi:MAG: hypothetical protein AAGL23_16910 [Pseudomonadota bacterium]
MSGSFPRSRERSYRRVWGLVALALSASFVIAVTAFGAVTPWQQTLPWLDYFIAAAAITLSYAVFDNRAATVLGRAVIVAVPIGFLGYGAFVLLQPAFDIKEVRFLYQGMITGGVLAVGWIFTFMLQTWRDEAARDVKVKETLTALREEIFDFLGDIKKISEEHLVQRPKTKSADQDEQVKALLVCLLDTNKDGKTIPETIAADDSYFRYVTKMKELRLFNAIIDDVQMLPNAVLPALVGFYAQLQDLDAITQAVQDERFWNLPQDRRAELFFEYENVLLEAIHKGCVAWHEINQVSEEPATDVYAFWLIHKRLNDSMRKRPDFTAIMTDALGRSKTGSTRRKTTAKPKKPSGQ